MSTGNRGNKRLKPNSTPLPNEVVCCLCRTKIDYKKQDPRRFFKHIREVHGLWPKKPEIEDEPMPKPQMQVKPDGKDSDVEIIGEVKNVAIIGEVKDPGFSDLFWF